jgi:hypothetical protein
VFLGFGPVLEQVGHPREGEGLGFGLDELAPSAGDGLDGLFGDAELVGAEDAREVGQGEVVVVAQVEGADGRVEQVLEEVVGEDWLLWLCLVCLCVGVDAHDGIVA